MNRKIDRGNRSRTGNKPIIRKLMVVDECFWLKKIKIIVLKNLKQWHIGLPAPRHEYVPETHSAKENANTIPRIAESMQRIHLYRFC